MATKKPRGLGLGLEALLGPRANDAADDASAAGSGAPRTLHLDQLQPGRYQPRTRMDEGALYELAESIRAQGIMQPVLVRRIGTVEADDAVAAKGNADERGNDRADGAGVASSHDAGMRARGSVAAGVGDNESRYEIIAGERRVRAAKLAGLTEVPVLVRDVPDEAAAVMSLIENIQREDLNPLEEAHGLKRLTDEFGLTHEEAARAVGRSRSTASNLLRLLNLNETVQQLLMAGDLDMGHARALLVLDGAQQILSANEIVARKLSVREAEKLVARASGDATTIRRQAGGRGEKPRELTRIERLLSDALAAAVEIHVRKRTRRGEQGEVVIRFGSLDELNGLLDRLGLSAT